ncbi:restriction endonuclease subunit S [uncultured Catenibacterium sp.]|uniref:restriction endonuclease subunit S n=1 Tax=uncultured Catenibacterium sp. TaxID=286142 RepID=UPI0025950D32|nr:restriction endonuclease subunit S [uncultured Catenibacterium sp.]
MIKQVFLSDILKFKNGKKRPKEGGTVPVYGGNGILGYSNSSNSEECIIIGRVGAYCGNVYYEKNKCWISDNAISAYVKEGIDIVYAYYLLKSLHLNRRKIGTSQPLLTQEILNNIETPIIPYFNQIKVGKILSIIDEKIYLNTEINNNLLQQLHVLYLRLFCNSAMDTPLGDVVATTSGGTPSRKHDEYYSDSSICWVKSKELLGNYIHETEEHINDLAIKKSSAKLLPEHSVLIAMYGATVGAYGVISKPMTCNQAVCALLCNENYPYTYLFQIAYESQQKFINLAVGSAQQNISQVLIKQLNLHSDLNIIQRFHDLALPMHQEIEFLQAENIRLSDLRDNLLPKLMSGELDVSDIVL